MNLLNSEMVGFFTNFGAKRNPNWWATHGMHACMPCGFVRSIKKGLVEEKRGKEKKKKKMREKEREEGKSVSFFLEFRHSDRDTPNFGGLFFFFS